MPLGKAHREPRILPDHPRRIIADDLVLDGPSGSLWTYAVDRFLERYAPVR